MNDDRRTPPPEQPRFEPEILPPERNPTPAGYDNLSGAGQQRIFVSSILGSISGAISPWRLAVWAVFAVLMVAGMLFVFAGALLIAIPVVAIMVGGSYIYRKLTGAGPR